MAAGPLAIATTLSARFSNFISRFRSRCAKSSRAVAMRDGWLSSHERLAIREIRLWLSSCSGEVIDVLTILEEEKPRWSLKVFQDKHREYVCTTVCQKESYFHGDTAHMAARQS